MRTRVTTQLAVGLLLLLVMAKMLAPSAAAEPKNGSSDQQTDRSVTLRHRELTESSGLAVSHRQPGLFWSHNDSGGQPRLFAFDQFGNNTGVCRLRGARAVDWEDMASFVLNGKAQLLVADCGDNQAKRRSISLYLLDEPDPRETTDLTRFTELAVSYPDGAHDCEAIAVDTHRDQIILIAKASLSTAGIYTVPLSRAAGDHAGLVKLTAKRHGGLLLPMASAMDLHPTSGDIWIINYFNAFRFPCGQRNQPLDQQLGKLPEPVELPRWKQIEAVAVDPDARVWVTSEGTPARLGRLRVKK